MNRPVWEQDTCRMAGRTHRRGRAPRLVLLLSLFVATGCIPLARDGAGGTNVDQDLDRIAREAVADHGLPGLSVVVLDRGHLALARGYGNEEPSGARASVGPGTVFQLGSISKQYLAVEVLRLSERGLLALDDPVARHLPAFAHLPADMTVRTLLNHTSGLREPFTLPAYEAGIEDLARPASELRGILRTAPIDFRPGARWSYSNANYLILALLVERLTGLPYELALERDLFGPLGLHSMRQCSPLPLGPGEARGHVLRNSRVAVAAPENMHWIRGDGGLCGNALDVARWLRLLAHGQVLGTESWQAMTTPTPLADGSIADYGFAMSLVPMEGMAKVSHNGAMLGYSASAAYYPETDLAVVVLTNLGDVRTESIERAIARRSMGLALPADLPRPLPKALASRLAGAYDIGVFAIRIVPQGEGLRLEMPPPGANTALRYLGGCTFASEGDTDATRVDFDCRDPQVGKLRLFMAAMHWYGMRKP